MIVALDATPLTVPTGGIRRYCVELARALAQNHPEDEYWLLSDQPGVMPENCPRNLRAGSGPVSAVSRKWWLWGLHQEMMRRKAELFHGTDFSVPYFPLRPSVMTVHDLSPWIYPAWQPGASRIRRRSGLLLRSGIATMVITPTEAIRRAVIERFRLQAVRVAAIPLAASAEFRPVDVERANFFLFVGTLEPRKNVAGLIEAWREVRKTHAVDLVIAGRERADFPPVAPEPGLEIRGEVEEAELPALYSRALAVVYPSLYEGFGLPVLEAMQCGALVVASRDAAIMEVSADGAVHVDARDTRDLAGVMAAIAAAPQKFQGLREAARERAKSFSWSRTAEKTREVYVEARRVFKR